MTQQWVPLPTKLSPSEIAEASRGAPEVRSHLLMGMRKNHANFRAAHELYSDMARTANGVTAQCRIADSRTLVIAIDFSEIVDYAHPYEGKGPDASVLHDMMISRVAIDLLRDGASQFTILPGTAQEIVNFLLAAVRHNAAALRVIESASDDVPIPELRTILEEIAPLARPGERVAEVVLDLLQSPGFVDISALPISPRKPKRRSPRAAWLKELKKRRPERSISNTIDADNLSAIVQANQAAGQPGRSAGTRYMFQLLTRTGVLYSIAGNTDVRADLQVRQPIDEWWCDVLLAPATYVMWKTIERQSPHDTDAQFEAASGIEEISNDLAVRLRTLAYRTRPTHRNQQDDEENSRHLLNTLAQLRQAMLRPQYRYIDEFRHLMEADVEFSAQLLSNAGRLWSYAKAEGRDVAEIVADVQRDMLRTAAVRTQDMLVRAYDALRVMCGGLPLDAIVGRPSESAGESGHSGGSVLGGMKVYINYPLNESFTWFVPKQDVHPKADPQDDIEHRSLFGVTVHKGGNRTVFWTTRRTFFEIVAVLDEADPTEIGDIVAIGYNEKMDVRVSPTGSLTDIVGELKIGPVRAIQIDWKAGGLFTWEAPRFSVTKRRGAFCSIRGSRSAGTDFHGWIVRLRRCLPIDVEEAAQALKWGRYV